MSVMRISGGHKFRLRNKPSSEVIQVPEARFIALSLRDAKILRPKVLVKQGDQVSLGQALIADKNDERWVLTSPGSGKVHEIRFGPRRSLEAVVIEIDKNLEKNPAKEKALSLNQISELNKSQIEEIMIKTGLWPYLQSFPGEYIAPTHDIADIAAVHVQLFNTEPHWPDAKMSIAGRHEEFLAGLCALKVLAPVKIFTEKGQALEAEVKNLASVFTIEDKYPADDLGVQAFYTGSSGQKVIGVSSELVLDLGHQLLHGFKRVERLFSVAGDVVHKPQHYRSRIGVAVGDLLKDSLKCTDDVRLIAGGLFTGKKVKFNDFLGPNESAVQALKEDKKRIPFVFFRLGADKLTLSKAWLSGFKKDFEADISTNNNGEERACVQCGYCIDICPVKLLPNLILKASLTKDIEKMQELSIADCVDCGLCTFVCPSKIELGQEIIRGKQLIEKEG